MDARSDYGVVEWTIQNISCWHQDFHDRMMRSLDCFGNIHFEMHLYSGKISVKMIWRFRSKVLGDLSVVGSDGHVFRSEEVDFYNEKNINSEFELPSLLLREVAERIEKKDDFLKDYITVRFRMRDASSNVFPMKTVIPTNEFTYKIESVKRVGCYYSATEDSCIVGTLKFRSEQGLLQSVGLYVYEKDYSYVHFKFKVTRKSVYACIRTHMFLMRKDETVLKRQVFVGEECVLSNHGDNSFRSDLTSDKVCKGGEYILMRLRVIPKCKSRLQCTDETPHITQKDETIAQSNAIGRILPEDDDELVSSDSEEFPDNTSEGTEADNSNKCENSLNFLSKDLMGLYQDQKFSDCEFKCGDITFPVHRNILSARSLVFETMLSCDMKETLSRQVVITDLDPSTLGLFLTFLYTGAVGEEGLQSESALNLYYAADKYQVPSLKTDCVDFLSDNVSISNVCDILSLADKHGDEVLSSVSRDFILNNYSEVVCSNEWDSLVKSDPALVAKTLTYFSVKKLVGKLSTE